MSAATQRRCWARAMIKRCRDRIPLYGSPEWAALPEGHFAKIAAVIRAAECWAREGDDLESSLQTEVAELQHAHKAAEDADYLARIDAHRQQWAHLNTPKHASLVARSNGGQRTPPRDPYDIGREYSRR